MPPRAMRQLSVAGCGVERPVQPIHVQGDAAGRLGALEPPTLCRRLGIQHVEAERIVQPRHDPVGCGIGPGERRNARLAEAGGGPVGGHCGDLG